MANIYLGDLDLLVGKQDRNIYFNNITASNWVDKLETIEEIINYDYKSGYPDKLVF